MLVLSRRCNEDIVFPAIGVTLKVLRTQGNRTQIGIEAPPHIEVLRREAYERTPEGASNHRLRNDMNSVTLLLEMFNRQAQRNNPQLAHQTYLELLVKLKQLDRDYGGRAETPDDAPTDAASRPRILVVEDDDNERELLAGLLRMDDCEVSTASDGVDALDQLVDGLRPDFLLLDMGIPRVDGCSLLQVIRREPILAELPVFVISGRRADELGISVDECSGVQAWFQKPLNPAALMKSIHDHPSRRKLTA